MKLDIEYMEKSARIAAEKHDVEKECDSGMPIHLLRLIDKKPNLAQPLYSALVGY